VNKFKKENDLEIKTNGEEGPEEKVIVHKAPITVQGPPPSTFHVPPCNYLLWIYAFH
jgi:hypothetical protein